MRIQYFAPVMITLFLLLNGCKGDKNKADASGVFEAEETIISAEANGTLKSFTVREGQELQAGELVGTIDSVQLYLKKKQLEAQIRTTLSQRPNMEAQMGALKAQLAAAEREQQRITNLLKANAATPKQMDDVNAQVDVLRKQIQAQQSALGITTESLNEQASPIDIQIEQLQDQLAKCRLINPMKGTVLVKYAEANEMALNGKPLYKIADVSTLLLRAYVSGAQLPELKLNQSVKVLVDDGAKAYRELDGVITWISDKAEFTPKTIQTKDERANLVYAIKVQVKNDGRLKIGMYGEVNWTH